MGQTLDEEELDDELAELQQEELDNKMLETGQVPVTDEVSRLPSVARGERKWDPIIQQFHGSMAPFLILTILNTAVGKKPVRVEEDDEEEELRKLQAEMAM